MPSTRVETMDTAPDDVTERQSRRRFFTMGASAIGALATSAAVANAQPPRGGGRSTPLPTGTTPGSDVAKLWRDPTLRLVRRITMGMEPSEVALARRLGFSGYLDYHLRASEIDDSALEATIAARLPMLGMSLAMQRTQDQNEMMEQIGDGAWYRAAFAKAQLRERMVEFWTDHFNISIDKVGYLKIADDRDVIRANALGNFLTMVRMSSKSGAMMRYLDQFASRTPTPNQNYAREIMELHTMGSTGGYTQTDVAELSRILTGYSTDNDGNFRYVRTFHDRNAKTFLGRMYPAMPATATDAQMMGEAEAAIEQLLAHPSTARYVSWKMARFLLAYDPPAAVVDATAATFTRTGGDIKSMIRTILTTQNLTAAPAKFKRPFMLAVSSLRALGTDTTLVPNIRQARQRADQMGMPLFRWQQPNGFPEEVAWWSGLAITRWSYAQVMSTMTSTTTARFDLSLFRTPDTADGVVNQINARLFAGEMSVATRSGLLAYLRGGTYNEARIRETLSLALSANEFQWF